MSVMRRTSYATLEFPEDTLVMLSSHVLFTSKPPPACPLLALEWYSMWPLWRVVKLSSFLRTSLSPIMSHFMLFSFSYSSSSWAFSYFNNVLTLYVAIFSRSPLVLWFFLTQILLAPLYVVSADPNHLLGHRHSCCWGLEALAYLYLHAGFHGLPFHTGQCGLEGGTEIGVPSPGSCVPSYLPCYLTQLLASLCSIGWFGIWVVLLLDHLPALPRCRAWSTRVLGSQFSFS